MRNNLVAKASTNIQAARAVVWDALTNPESIKKYMLGTNVTTTWREGSPIYWKGEWKGKPYQDKGVILRVQPNEKLEYTHYSPLTGKPDVPDSYHTVTVTLIGQGDQTSVSIAQDNNPDDEARKHSEENWNTMLSGLRKYVEGNG